MGWSVFTVGYLEGAKNPARPSRVRAPRPGTIENETLRVRARRGARGVNIQYRGRPLFGASGLSVITLDDPWGSWGGIDNEPASDQLDKVLHTWTIEDVRTLETGPELARLWVLLRGGRSSLELAFSLSRDRAVVDVSGRLLLDERSARVSLRLPTSARTAEYEVPGGLVRRGFLGDVSGGRWARVGGASGFGFASDALYGFCLRQGEFRAHIARATRYTADGPAKADERPWEAAMDRGELLFQFLLAPGRADLPRLAAELERPPAVQIVTDHPGKLPRSHSLASLTPDGLELLALKPAENGRGWILRIQNRTGRAVPRAVWTWLDQRLVLGRIPDGRIATWRLTESAKRWRATPVSANEVRR